MNKNYLILVSVSLAIIVIASFFIMKNNEKSYGLPEPTKDYSSFIDYLNQNPEVAEKLSPYMYYNEDTDFPTFLHWVYYKINEGNY